MSWCNLTSISHISLWELRPLNLSFLPVVLLLPPNYPFFFFKLQKLHQKTQKESHMPDWTIVSAIMADNLEWFSISTYQKHDTTQLSRDIKYTNFRIYPLDVSLRHPRPFNVLKRGKVAVSPNIREFSGCLAGRKKCLYPLPQLIPRGSPVSMYNLGHLGPERNHGKVGASDECSKSRMAPLRWLRPIWVGKSRTGSAISTKTKHDRYRQPINRTN